MSSTSDDVDPALGLTYVCAGAWCGIWVSSGVGSG